MLGFRGGPKWWRGHEVIIATVLLVLAVVGVWLAMLIGSQASGADISGNPVKAVEQLALGHVDWPGGWANAFLVFEVLFLVALWWVTGRIMRERMRGEARDETRNEARDETR
jgi:hypothetical protein